MPREYSIQPHVVKEITFPVYFHQNPLTVFPKDRVFKVMITVGLSRTAHGKAWHPHSVHIPPAARTAFQMRERSDKRSRRSPYQPNTSVIALAAFIALYKEGIDPTEVRGLVGAIVKISVSDRTQEVLNAFNAWKQVYEQQQAGAAAD